MKIIIGIVREDKSWKQIKNINVSLIRSVITQTLKTLPNFVEVSVAEIAILLTSNDHMQQLNYDFLQKNYPTNVLSFPEVYISPKSALDFYPSKDYIYLGDIAFGYDIIVEEAQRLSKTFEQHFVHLLVHGVLHLLGFDHTENDDMFVMQKLEILILETLGISSPY